MCLAIHKPAGTQPIPAAYLQSAVAKNGDGFGFAYIADGELRVERFLPEDAKRFMARYREVEKTGTAIIAHARLATHGSKTIPNTHPFTYDDPAGFEVAVIHNGIIRIRTEGDMSDTETFVRLVLAQLPSRWWKVPALMFLVEEAIGYGNKLVLLTEEGEVVVVNEDSGHTEDGIWYSNTYSLPSKWTSTYTPRNPLGAKPYVLPGQGASGSTYTKGKTPATPTSKRSQKRAERNAAKRAKRNAAKVAATFEAMSTDKALTVVGVPAESRTLTHVGHVVNLTGPVDRAKDGDYQAGVICAECGTIGDAYLVDRKLYFDLNHYDQLSAAGI